MSETTANYSRPEKGDHLSTIQYEMEMLRFCHENLISKLGKWDDEKIGWVYLEAFLVHYRNLVEFFGDEGDLKASEPEVWASGKLGAAQLASISDRKLCKKYRGPISAYLQHCTKLRANVDRSWNVAEMYEEIKGLIANFHAINM